MESQGNLPQYSFKKQPENVEYFNHMGSMITNDAR